MSIYAIPQKSTDRSSLLTFMVIAEKDNLTSFSQISSSIDQSLIAKNGNQVEACVCYLSGITVFYRTFLHLGDN